MSSKTVTINTPTLQLVHELETAYKYFNRFLFDNKLKPCLILMHRKRSALGYFWAKRWQQGEGEEAPVFHELALNPDHLKGRPIKDTLSTLVHEQVHLWQEDFGKPPKGPGHNREWGDKMESLGLMPSRTGQPDGKRTGRRVTHYIITGGKFEEVCDDLLETGFTLSCVSWPQLKAAKVKVRKVTYECTGCEAKVRGKAGLKLICGDCSTDDEQVEFN